jgi:hypothetical protein
MCYTPDNDANAFTAGLSAKKGGVTLTRASDTPLRFDNSLLINAAFPLPSSNARALLPEGAHINLVEVFPGRAVLVASLALYRTSPFGTYAEAVLALMASHEKTTPVMTLTSLLQASRYPAYVLHMLVNNEDARQTGVQQWALPRVLAEVTIVEEQHQVIGTASLDGQPVMQMIAERPTSLRSRSGQIETYTRSDDTLLRTVMRCEAQQYGRKEGGGATLIWGEHPIGEHMANMRVSQMPLMVRYYEQTRAEIDPPTPCTVS